MGPGATRYSHHQPCRSIHIVVSVGSTIPACIASSGTPRPPLLFPVKSVKITNKIIKLVLFLFQRCPCSAVAMVTPASFSEFRTRSPPVASAACPHFLHLPTFHLAQAPPTPGCPHSAPPLLGLTGTGGSLPRPHPLLSTPLAGPTYPSSICWLVPVNQHSAPSHAMSLPVRSTPLLRQQPHPAQFHPWLLHFLPWPFLLLLKTSQVPERNGSDWVK